MRAFVTGVQTCALPLPPAAAATCLDGYPRARSGRAGVALFMTTAASFVAAIIGILILTFFAPLLVKVALAFGPAEYFAIMLLGLVAAAAITMGSAIKGIGMVTVGILIGQVGTAIHIGRETCREKGCK